MTLSKTKLMWVALFFGAVAIALLIIRFDRTARQTRAEIRSLEKKRLAVETKLAEAKALPATASPVADPVPAALPPPEDRAADRSGSAAGARKSATRTASRLDHAGLRALLPRRGAQCRASRGV